MCLCTRRNRVVVERLLFFLFAPAFVISLNNFECAGLVHIHFVVRSFAIIYAPFSRFPSNPKLCVYVLQSSIYLIALQFVLQRQNARRTKAANKSSSTSSDVQLGFCVCVPFQLVQLPFASALFRHGKEKENIYHFECCHLRSKQNEKREKNAQVLIHIIFFCFAKCFCIKQAGIIVSEHRARFEQAAQTQRKVYPIDFYQKPQTRFRTEKQSRKKTNSKRQNDKYVFVSAKKEFFLMVAGSGFEANE